MSPEFACKCALEQLVLLLNIHVVQSTVWSGFDDSSIQTLVIPDKKHNVTYKLPIHEEYLHYGRSCTY